MSFTSRNYHGSGFGSGYESISGKNQGILDPESPYSVEPPSPDWKTDATSITSNEKYKGHLNNRGNKTPFQSLHGNFDLSFLWMLVWFVLGLAACILHYLFNTYCDQKTVEGDRHSFHSLQNQRVTTFIGTAFAFLIKGLYALSLNSAYQQVVWRVWTNRPSTVAAMDNVICVPEDATRFLSWELWKYAKRPIFIGIIIWLSFLGTLFVPGTLSVEIDTTFTNYTRQVPTLDFLAIINNTPYGYKRPFLIGDVGRHEPTFTGISPEMERLRAITSYGGVIPGPESPCGLNCTYIIRFPGPAQKCDNIPDYTLEESHPWQGGNGSGNATSAHPNPVYGAGVRYYDAAVGQDVKEKTGAQDLWISWAYRHDPDGEIPVLSLFESPSQNLGNKSQQWELRTIRCIDYNATYTVEVKYVNGVERMTTSLEYLHKTKYNADNGKSLIYTGGAEFGPHSGPIDPGGVYLHRAMKTALIKTLEGSLGVSGGAASRAAYGLDSLFIGTKLTRPYKSDGGGSVSGESLVYLAIPDLGRGIEELAVNLTLSMLGTNDLVYRDPTGATAMVHMSEVRNVFSYKPRNLILSYALLTGFSAIAVVMGLVAASRNGFWASTTFATMYVATRGREAVNGGGTGDGTERLLRRRLRLRLDEDGETYFTDAGFTVE